MKPLLISLLALIVVTVIVVDASENSLFWPKRLTEQFPERDAYELGDIMKAMQTNHAKLWFAGQAKNWELATYELDEMEEGFNDAMNRHSVYRKDNTVSELFDRTMADPLHQIRSVIKAQDSLKFEPAFDTLTSACNSCHQETKHGFIVIKRPKIVPFSDQDFNVQAR